MKNGTIRKLQFVLKSHKFIFVPVIRQMQGNHQSDVPVLETGRQIINLIILDKLIAQVTPWELGMGHYLSGFTELFYFGLGKAIPDKIVLDSYFHVLGY